MSGYITDTINSKLGGGRPGVQPRLLGGGATHSSGSGMTGGSERSTTRRLLRRAAGRHSFISQSGIPLPITSGLTNFREFYNAGDYLGTVNQASHPNLRESNQINGIIPSKLKANGGGVASGKSAFSGNPKYVYDSSNYTTFKKLGAQLKTYNDASFGGSNNGSYVFLLHARH